jgi:hypothetical protein
VFGFGKKKLSVDTWVIDPTGRCTVECRGESQYQDALRKVIGGKPKEEVRVPKQAALIPEPDNKHDRNAVKVYIDGVHVAYLAAEEAEDYAEGFALCQSQKRGLACQAVIVGGGKKKPSLGVWVDLPTPAKLLKQIS